MELGVGFLNDLAPCVDAGLRCAAEVDGGDWGKVFGVDVCDHDCLCAGVDESLYVLGGDAGEVGGEVGVLRVTEPEGVGVFGEVVLAGPNEGKAGAEAGGAAGGIVGDLIRDAGGACVGWSVGGGDRGSELGGAAASTESVVKEGCGELCG